MFIFQWTLFFLEDTLGFSQKAGAIRSISALGRRTTERAGVLIHGPIHSGSSIIGPILPHLEEIRAAAEKDVFSPAVGLAQDENLVTISQNFVGERVEDIGADEHGSGVAETK